MTLSAWVNPAAANGGWRTVMLKERTGALSYALYGNTDTAHAGGYVATPLESSTKSTSALAAGVWTHLATTFDGATLRMFVNGVQVSSRAVTGSIVVGTGALRIGGNAVWWEYFSGLIDEVRVYNRALSAAELQTDMATPVTCAVAAPPPALSVTPASLSLQRDPGRRQPGGQDARGRQRRWRDARLDRLRERLVAVGRPASGTRGTVTVTPTLGALTAGTYTTDVTITATAPPKTIPVTFTVDPMPPALSVTPSSLAFTQPSAASAAPSLHRNAAIAQPSGHTTRLDRVSTRRHRSRPRSPDTAYHRDVVSWSATPRATPSPRSSAARCRDAELAIETAGGYRELTLHRPRRAAPTPAHDHRHAVDQRADVGSPARPTSRSRPPTAALTTTIPVALTARVAATPPEVARATRDLRRRDQAARAPRRRRRGVEHGRETLSSDHERRRRLVVGGSATATGNRTVTVTPATPGSTAGTYTATSPSGGRGTKTRPITLTLMRAAGARAGGHAPPLSFTDRGRGRPGGAVRRRDQHQQRHADLHHADDAAWLAVTRERDHARDGQLTTCDRRARRGHLHRTVTVTARARPAGRGRSRSR